MVSLVLVLFKLPSLSHDCALIRLNLLLKSLNVCLLSFHLLLEHVYIVFEVLVFLCKLALIKLQFVHLFVGVLEFLTRLCALLLDTFHFAFQFKELRLCLLKRLLFVDERVFELFDPHMLV